MDCIPVNCPIIQLKQSDFNMKPSMYLRVSTPDQNIEAQRIECLQYCTGRNWPIPFEFSDVISGSTSKRPGLDALLAAVNQGIIDCIVVVKLDRIGRSIRYVLQLMDEMEAKNVLMVATSQGIDTSSTNAMSKLMRGMLAVFAEFERELIRERTIAGLAAARARGRIGGQRSGVPAMRSEWPAIINAWHDSGGPGGYRELAVRLGGVSTATAWKLARVPREVSPVVSDWVE